ncbi:MAG TPA: nitroreductase family protein [Thermomicrobiaceae bacterium]|nr:nitroreductase family protein [Thermomicrobiaceae bacterium]
MEVYEAVRTVLAVREFRGDPLPEVVVRKIARAARLTASSQNGQPWHFVVVDDRETLRQLGELARTGHYVGQAPLAVAVAYETGSRFGVSDASRAIQDMILVAWAEGVGTNWVGFGGLEAIKPVLGLPDNLELLAIVPFGYPAHPRKGTHKQRKPIGEVVSHNRYGQPFA